MQKSLIDLLEAYPIKEDPGYDIYCDMDGVLTDFKGRFDHYTGVQPDEYIEKHGERMFWSLIDQEIGLVFWSKMDWMPEGKRLWEYIKEYKPTLLTSPSENDVSRLGKNTWVKNNILEAPEVIFAKSENKYEYASPNAILIDDKKSNIREWKAAGGIAIRCIDGDVESVINQLKKLGYE